MVFMWADDKLARAKNRAARTESYPMSEGWQRSVVARLAVDMLEELVDVGARLEVGSPALWALEARYYDILTQFPDAQRIIDTRERCRRCG